MWQARYGQLDKWRFDEYFETRVLAWLWLRPNRQVRAVRNPELAQHYECPLLDVLADGDRINPFVWLQLMSDQAADNDRRYNNASWRRGPFKDRTAVACIQ